MDVEPNNRIFLVTGRDRGGMADQGGG